MIKAMTDDLVFAHIMSCKKEYVKRLIHYITNIPLKELQDLKYLDTNLKEDYRKNKHYRSDVITKINDFNIILEMNKNPSQEYSEKNISYLFSIHNQNNRKNKKYIMGQKYLLLNFDFNGNVGNELINKYTLKDRNGKEYPIDIEIYHIKLDKLQNREYTKSVKEEILNYLKIMVLEDEQELIEISKGDDILKDVIREMIHYDAMDVPFGYRDVDEEQEWMMNSIRDRHKEELKEERRKGLEKGIKKGEAKGIEKTAKNMLDLDVDINTISKATGLSINAIMKL